MKTLILFFLTLPLFGQQVVRYQHLTRETVANLANTFMNKAGTWQVDEPSKSLFLNGPPELVALVISSLKELDVAPKAQRNLELTFYAIAATEAGSPLLVELEGVAKQLKATFGFANLRLLEAIQVRAREGRGSEATGIMGKASGNLPNLYQLKFNEVRISGDEKARTIRINSLRFGSKISTGTNYVDTGFTTDVDLKEGQKIVIGKSSLDPTGAAFFVVLTAKVLD